MKNKLCWTITDGSAGMMTQVRGLGEALGYTPIEKVCRRPEYLAWMPGTWLTNAPYLTKTSDDVSPPWPDVLITCGRRSVPLSLYIKKKSGGKTFCVHIQDPRISSKHFDVVVAMDHDKIEGNNVFKVASALHGITPEKLKKAAENKIFESYERPYYGVILGGDTHRFKFSKEVRDDLVGQLKKILELSKGTLLISPSRRTPLALLQEIGDELKIPNRVMIADLEKYNPYFEILAQSDMFFISEDSVSMLSEACSTGKPVYMLSLLGHEGSKAKKFAEKLSTENKARFFKGALDVWSAEAFNETQRIASIIKQEQQRQK